MNEIAVINPNEITVRPSARGTEKWLTIDCPNDWEDVKKICKKVLTYGGEKYTFRGWNSDRHEAMFIQSNNVATIGRS